MGSACELAAAGALEVEAIGWDNAELVDPLADSAILYTEQMSLYGACTREKLTFKPKLRPFKPDCKREAS